MTEKCAFESELFNESIHSVHRINPNDSFTNQTDLVLFVIHWLYDPVQQLTSY